MESVYGLAGAGVNVAGLSFGVCHNGVTMCLASKERIVIPLPLSPSVHELDLGSHSH